MSNGPLDVDHSQQTHRGIIPKGLERFVDGPLLPQPDWERVSDTVLTVLAPCKHSFALNGTNTFLVGTGPKRLLIDCGDVDEADAQRYVDRLSALMAEEGVTELVAVIATHAHIDHIGGIHKLRERFGEDLPFHKWPTDPTSLERWRGYLETGGDDDEHHALWTERLWFEEQSGYLPISDGQVFSVEGASLTAIHTPGHAGDHVVLWLDPDRCLFSGDHVLGWGTSWVEDLGHYMESLQTMIGLDPLKLYPGHGPMIEHGRARLDKYVAHRRAREVQIALALKIEAGPGAHCVKELVAILYDSDSEHVVQNAAGNVIKVLIKLEREGRVTAHEPDSDGAVLTLAPTPASPFDPYYRTLEWKWTDQAKM